MTGRAVYGVSLFLTIGAFACTLAAVLTPNWITYTSPADNDTVVDHIGLYKRCNSITGHCRPYPRDESCIGSNARFCSMWRAAGPLMEFTIIMELACLVAYLITFAAGRNGRESGYKVIAPLLVIISATQMTAMALVAYCLNNDPKLFLPWQVDAGFILATVSWSVTLVHAVGLVTASTFLPPEDDYEPIP